MDILDHDLYEQRQLLLEKYKSHILTARIILFILIGYLYLEFSIALHTCIEKGYTSGVPRYSALLIITTIGLIFTLLTYIRPYIFLVLLVILCFLGAAFIYYFEIVVGRISFSFSAFDYNGTIPFWFLISSFVLRSSVLFFVIRGMVAARKYGKLRKSIKNHLL